MEIQAPKSSLSHRIDIQPRFSDYDLFGHLNNGAVLAYFDLGKAEFLGQITGDPFDPRAVSAVIVNVNANYYAVSLPGEKLAVLTGVAHVGERSFTLEQRLVAADDGAVKATVLTVMAGIDLDTQQGAPLNPSLHAALTAALG